MNSKVFLGEKNPTEKYLIDWEQFKEDMKYINGELSDMHSDAAGTLGATAYMFVAGWWNAFVTAGWVGYELYDLVRGMSN